MPEESEVVAPESIGLSTPAESPAEGGDGKSSLTGAAPSEAGPESAPGSADDFDLTSLDYRRVKLEDVPEKHRKTVEAIQKQVKASQAQDTRRFQDLEAREKALESQRREILELQKSLTRPQQQEAKDTVDDLLSNPNLTPDERRGLQVVQQMLDKALGPYKGLLEKLPKLEEQLGGLTKAQEDGRRKAVRDQVQEAVDAYGDDINEYADLIRHNLGLDDKNNPVGKPMTNPATGKPYTVKELYELYTGKTQKAATSLREQDAELRGASKGALRGTPRSATRPDSGEDLTEAEARAKVRELRIGRT